MSMAQKQAPDKKDEALREANMVFRSLETPRYQPIMPVGISIDSVGLPDFRSGQSHSFKLFNVRPEEVESLLKDKIVDKLTAALAKYDPSAGKISEFVAVNVTYNEKNGDLEFTLKITDKPTLLARKQ